MDNNRINERILRLAEVMEIVGLSRSTIYAWIAEGTFPRYVRLGNRSVGWLKSEIDQFIQKCAEATRKHKEAANAKEGGAK
ncbi:MAG: AlpA family transcriptional regulator [Alphaproteobacteria bacterium]|nr:AlpA family transcriptional regulator [Alphaproteobacteria bacterium]